ncbi:RTC4-like domain-containing protein [Biscogniauxia marginata]|nr:RTC4-like domain-containing protein [Biscogniauxia marginata]
MAPQPRVVGLSKLQRPRSLLKQIKGRPSQDLEPKASKEDPSSLEMGGGTKDEDLEFITAPPQSSDDEEENQALGQTIAGPPDSDDDDDDDVRRRRDDIRRTNFSNIPSSQASSTRKSRREKTKPSSRYGKKTGDSRVKEPSSSASSKRSVDEARAGMGNHLRDDYGFTRPPKKPRAKRSSTYSSQPRASQKSEARSSTPKANIPSPSRQSFIHPSNSLSPEIIRTSPKGRFRIRKDSLDLEDTTGSKNTFRAPPPGPSLSSSPEASAFKHAIMSDDSPDKPKIKLFDLDEKKSPPYSQRPWSKAKLRKSQDKSTPRFSNDSPGLMLEEFSQRPAFKMPEVDETDAFDNSDIQEIITPRNDVDNRAENDVDVEETQLTTIARCPMCREVVDRELLNRHSDHGRMNIKKQAAFCRMHNRKAALNSGSERGYPKINWNALDSRCDGHQKFLKNILEGSQPSYYGKILKEQVQSGKNRTLLKTEDSLIPGYYGPRGLRVMTDYIMRTLSRVVRKRAVEDRLVSARGYTGYVQAVLVPELAVRLIMEDMSATEESAREIMQDSIKVGELLHEDVGDVIINLSDGEEI